MFTLEILWLSRTCVSPSMRQISKTDILQVWHCLAQREAIAIAVICNAKDVYIEADYTIECGSKMNLKKFAKEVKKVDKLLSKKRRIIDHRIKVMIQEVCNPAFVYLLPDTWKCSVLITTSASSLRLPSRVYRFRLSVIEESARTADIQEYLYGNDELALRISQLVTNGMKSIQQLSMELQVDIEVITMRLIHYMYARVSGDTIVSGGKLKNNTVDVLCDVPQQTMNDGYVSVYTDAQMQIIRWIDSNQKYMVVHGNCGSGKTTMLDNILYNGCLANTRVLKIENSCAITRLVEEIEDQSQLIVRIVVGGELHGISQIIAKNNIRVLFEVNSPSDVPDVPSPVVVRHELTLTQMMKIISGFGMTDMVSVEILSRYVRKYYLSDLRVAKELVMSANGRPIRSVINEHEISKSLRLFSQDPQQRIRIVEDVRISLARDQISFLDRPSIAQIHDAYMAHSTKKLITKWNDFKVVQLLINRMIE